MDLVSKQMPNINRRIAIDIAAPLPSVLTDEAATIRPAGSSKYFFRGVMEELACRAGLTGVSETLRIFCCGVVNDCGK